MITVFTQKEKKWKPRNKQAALIVRKANPNLLHTPPPVSNPVLEMSFKDRMAFESKIRVARIARIEKENEERRAKKAAERLANEKPKEIKKNKCMWVARYARKMSKNFGIPMPTVEQQRAMRKSHKDYGKPLYNKI